MYLKYSIQEFKEFCVNHKNELKKINCLRISTGKGSKSYNTLREFGTAILELEKDHSAVTITSIFGKGFNGNAYKTAEVFFDAFLNNEITIIEFNCTHNKYSK
jgi:hypothetical protein